jgi:hypothetical protein
MDQEFHRQQAQRGRDLADPFTKKCLLDLAESYGAKSWGPSRASRIIERPLPLARALPGCGRSGEA